MADISSYITTIQSASRGEEVRDAIINALIAINEYASASSEGASIGAVNDLFLQGTYYDSEPVEGSKKAVMSGGLYNILGDIGLALDTINGIVV